MGKFLKQSSRYVCRQSQSVSFCQDVKVRFSDVCFFGVLSFFRLAYNNKITSIKYYSKVNSNTIVSKDSIFNFSPEGIKKVEGILLDTIISDSRRRPIYKIQYYNNKFQQKQEFRYQNWGRNIVTELNFYIKPDSLWSIKEWQYHHITNLPIRKFYKTIGRGIESKEIYVYNRKQLLVKVLLYSGDELDGYHKYKYKFFK